MRPERIVMVLCLALAWGCGRCDPPSAPSRPASAPHQDNPALRPASAASRNWMQLHQQYAARAARGGIDVLFLGDSLTHGWGGPGKAAWTEHFAPLEAEAFGIPADRVEHVLYRITHGELAGISPKVLVLMIGTNNLKSGDIRHPPDQVAQGIAALLGEIRKRLPGSKVLLMGILPRQPQYEWFPDARDQTNRRLAALADADPQVRFLDIGGKMLGSDGRPDRTFYGSDLLHLSAAGYHVWAESAAPLIREMIAPAAPGRGP
jgi:lysophospholipase L1-like esterase